MVLLVVAGDDVIGLLPPANLAPSTNYMWKLNSIPKILDNWNILAMELYYLAQYSVLLPRRGLESAVHVSYFQFDTLV